MGLGFGLVDGRLQRLVDGGILPSGRQGRETGGHQAAPELVAGDAVTDEFRMQGGELVEAHFVPRSQNWEGTVSSAIVARCLMPCRIKVGVTSLRRIDATSRMTTESVQANCLDRTP